MTTEAWGAFIDKLEQAIRFHETNSNDPYNVSNAVLVALREILNAAKHAEGLCQMDTPLRD